MAVNPLRSFATNENILDVLPLSDINAKEDLPRTLEAAQGPLQEIPDDLNAQKWDKHQWFFNNFEIAPNALGGLPNAAKGTPMASQSFQEMA